MNIRRLTFIWAMLFAVSGAFATEEVPTPHNITELKRPLILQFKNTGGYTGWFRVNWTTMEGEAITHTSSNIATGSTYILEVPTSAYLNSLRIEGFTNTGILWDRYREIFNVKFDTGMDVYSFMSHDYYALKTWGTTFSPRWETIVPTMGVPDAPGVDPYSEEPGMCTRFKISTGRYELENYCLKYDVMFHLSGQSGLLERRVNRNSKVSGYGYYNTVYTNRID